MRTTQRISNKNLTSSVDRKERLSFLNLLIMTVLLTVWMFVGAGEIYFNTGMLIYAFFVLCLAFIIIASALFFHAKRNNLNNYSIYAAVFLIAIPSFIAVFAIREIAGLKDYPLGIYGFVKIGVFSFLIVEMIYLSRKSK